MRPEQQTSLLRGEIVALHRFFVRWYSGTAAREEADAVLARFREDFVYIFPAGRCSNRADLVQMLASSHGANESFRIQVTGFEFQPLLPAAGLWGVTYKEYQAGARNSAPENGRISSAVFEIRDGAPRWVRLHECWLPPETVAAHHQNFGCLVRYGLPPAEADLPAIRAELAAETAHARQGAGNALRMRALCAQLFCAGHVEDALLIWHAKQASTDIESALLCAAGLPDTIAFLTAHAGAVAAGAVEQLRREAPRLGRELVGYRDRLLVSLQ